MAEIENYKGYTIRTATVATTSSMAATSEGFRVNRPNGSRLGGPFHSVEECHEAIDSDLKAIEAAKRAGQRYVLDDNPDGSQSVIDTTVTPRAKIGSIRFLRPGEHEAFDGQGKSLGVFTGGGEAKDAVVRANPNR